MWVIRSLRFILTLVLFFFSFSHLQAATITPNTFEDDAVITNDICSLREAVQAINQGSFDNPVDLPGCEANSEGTLGDNDTIILETGDYLLQIPGDDDLNAEGDIDIFSPVVIQGQGMGVTRVIAAFEQGEDRAFDLFVPNNCPDPIEFDVTFSGFTITKIHEEVVLTGGGIRNNGSIVTLTEMEVFENSARAGGGIYHYFFQSDCAAMFILRSLISENGGAVEGGGGIYSDAPLLIDESTIAGNAAGDGGGAGILTRHQTLITNSTINGNISSDEGNGGGILYDLDSGEAMIVINTTISGNQTGFNGGGVAHAFIQDDAANGISILSSDQRSGLVAQAPPLPIAMYFNVTIADNEALGSGGQLGSGGGLYVELDQVITGSQALSPQLFNTLVAENMAEEEGSEDCSGEYISMGFNFIGMLGPNQCIGFTDGVNDDQVGSVDLPKDPVIGDLQDNGGLTFTHALLPGSPAIDKANNTEDGCQAPDLEELLQNNFELVTLNRDQRAFPRPIAILDPNDPICDIGAYEVQPFQFSLTKTDGLGAATIPVGTEFDYTIVVSNEGVGDATDVVLSDPLPAGIGFVAVASSQGSCAEASGTVTCDLGDLADGASATVTITVVAQQEGTHVNVATVTLVNPFEQTETKTAHVTTTVGGLLLEGSGLLPCSLTRGPVTAPRGLALAVFVWLMLTLPLYLVKRGRAKVH